MKVCYFHGWLYFNLLTAHIHKFFSAFNHIPTLVFNSYTFFLIHLEWELCCRVQCLLAESYIGLHDFEAQEKQYAVSFINDLDDGGDITWGGVQAHWRTGLGVKMLLLYSRNGLNKIGCSLIGTIASRNKKKSLTVQIPGMVLLTI